MNKNVEIGNVYGYLKVLEQDKNRKRYYLCECQHCDNKTKKYIRKDHLLNGDTISCGCAIHEGVKKKREDDRKIKNQQYIEGNTLYVKCSNSNNYFMCDICDKKYVDAHTWYENDLGYICARDSNNKIIRFHRYIFGFKNQNRGNKYNVIDHIDGNPKNNTRENLKICNQIDNMKNIKIRKNNTTGYVGVEYVERLNRYHAYITANKQYFQLGYYENLEDAVKARRDAEKKFGFNIREV